MLQRLDNLSTMLGTQVGFKNKKPDAMVNVCHLCTYKHNGRQRRENHLHANGPTAWNTQHNTNETLPKNKWKEPTPKTAL